MTIYYSNKMEALLGGMTRSIEESKRNRKEYVLYKDNEVQLVSTHPEEIREEIEDLLSEHLTLIGVKSYISLQESVEDEEFMVYLHSDVYEELESEELMLLDIDYGLSTFNDELTWGNLQQMLNIRVQ